MATINNTGNDTDFSTTEGPAREIKKLIAENEVMIFATTTCPFCIKVKKLFESIGVKYKSVEFDNMGEEGVSLRASLAELVEKTSVPQVFVRNQHIGGYDDTQAAHNSGLLASLLGRDEPKTFDHDLIVIGGGSGGLAASKMAATIGKNVAVLDFVVPTPLGTTWGLGGTCVNVGCIPKKLMHSSALLGQAVRDAKYYGWNVSDGGLEHSWETLRDNIANYIRSLNWNYRVQLRSEKVKYKNNLARFITPHKIKAITKSGTEEEITARHFIVATGERPRYPDIPGAREYGITSDDLFYLSYCPGKTLVVGASYVALECAGFLRGLGLDVTVMVRSIFLRGFDQQMAEKIGAQLEEEGVKILRPCVPTRIVQEQDGTPGLYRAYGKMTDGDMEISDTFNTVLFAIGRDPCTKGIGLEEIGVELNPKNGRVVVNNEQTSVPNIYAIGDIIDKGLQLTPVAIQAGILLAKRLYGDSNETCDYSNVPTTVFTPLEYGCIGLAEEDAIAQYGQENIRVYHSQFTPLEWTVAGRSSKHCYCKLLCLKNQNEKVVGFHYLGPNAGEVTQGFSIGFKLGATKAHFDQIIGIHPTCAEIFTTLTVTKESGKSTEQKGC